MDSFRGSRVGALLFAMFSVGLLAVMSREPDGHPSEMWPAGLGAAALFSARRRRAPLVLLGVLVLALMAYVLGGRPLPIAVGGAVGVMLEALVIALVLTDGGRIRPALRNDRELTRFVVAIGLGGLVAAGVAMSAAAAYGDGAVLLAGLGTLVGHASSALFLLPFFMATDEHHAIARPVERTIQWTLALTLALSVFLLDSGTALLFLLIPVLGWAALRSPLREVQGQLLVVATFVTVLTTYGHGPFAEVPGRFALPDERTGIVLQTFLAACALVVVPLSLAVGQQVENARNARVERDRFQEIFNSANVAIIGTDQVGRVTLFNPGAERLLGYTAEQVMGGLTTMFHSPAAIAEVAEVLGVSNDFRSVVLKLAEPGTGAVDIKFLRQDGSERTHSLTLSRIVDDRGVAVGYVGTSEDVSERVAATSALVEALATERRAVERLQEVDQVKDTFVSAVSHELRTPITSIVGYLEMLQDGAYGPLNRQQDDALIRIDANSRRLLSLIDDLLTLSRVQEDGLGLEDRQLDLVDVVRTAYDVVAPAWATRDLGVRLELPERSVPFTGDEDMLERMVVNLVGNAVKFTPEGGEVSVALHLDDGSPVIQVADTGIGIPVEEQELLFTRFFRSSEAQRHAIPGSGLGLSIARAIIEMHGGDVTVESAPGVGTTFRVLLPSSA